jgi:hypothetical protein
MLPGGKDAVVSGSSIVIAPRGILIGETTIGSQVLQRGAIEAGFTTDLISGSLRTGAGADARADDGIYIYRGFGCNTGCFVLLNNFIVDNFENRKNTAMTIRILWKNLMSAMQRIPDLFSQFFAVYIDHVRNNQCRDTTHVFSYHVE